MEDSIVPKRPREESSQVEEDLDCEESLKRHKPYNLILSLLESEDEDPTQDLSPLMTTLQHEITCTSHDSDTLLSPPHENNSQHNLTTTLEEGSTSTSTTFSSNSNDIMKEDEKEKVMRHLLEASDDELGIPSRGDHGLLNFGDMFSSTCDGLWELEDETANYYPLLQSELFL